METIDILAILSRWIHILSVIIAVGGAFYVRLALLPAANATLPEDTHQNLRTAVNGSWKKIVHICAALLIVTGGFNFYIALQDGVKGDHAMPYHAFFGVKFLIAIAIIFYGIALSGSNPGFAKMRQNAEKSLTILITLAITAVLLSGLMKYFHQAAMLGTAS